MPAQTTLQIKGKASAFTTSDLAARELGIRTDAGEESIEFENSGATAVLRLPAKRTKGVTIEDPANGDRIVMMMNSRPITVTGVSFASAAGTSVVISLEFATTIASGTVIHSDTCATSTPEWDVTPSGDSTVPTDQIIALEVGTVTGSVTDLHVTFEYTVDA